VNRLKLRLNILKVCLYKVNYNICTGENYQFSTNNLIEITIKEYLNFK